MRTDPCTPDMDGAREVYELLNELDPHINSHDASGRALLYQAKERLRMLIINIDRSSVGVASPRPA
jgi:hypothetical protein